MSFHKAVISISARSQVGSNVRVYGASACQLRSAVGHVHLVAFQKKIPETFRSALPHRSLVS